MVVFIIIWIIFAISLIANFHKTFIVFSVITIFFIDGISLKYSAPALPVNLALQLQIIFISIVKKGIKPKNLPLYNNIILLISVYLLSILFTHAPIIQAITYTARFIIPFVLVFIFWKEYDFQRDFELFHKTVLFSAVIFISYTLIEFVFQSNPLLTYETSLIPEKLASGKVFLTAEDNIRNGTIRCQSFFSHSISLASVCYIYIIYFLFYLRYRSNSKDKKFVILLIPFLAFCLLISGARSPLVALLVASLGFLSAKQMSNINFLIFVFVALFAVIVFDIDELVYNQLSSLFSNEVSSEMKGSSMEVRTMQITSCFKAISSNPLFGLGAKGGEYALTRLRINELLGLESIWFKTLVETGLFGVVVYGLLYLKTYQFGKKKLNRIGAFFALSWILLNTMTTMPNIEPTLFYVFLFVMVSLQRNRKKGLLLNS